MTLTEKQKEQIRKVLLNQNTDCYFDTPRSIQDYLDEIIAIVEGE